MDENVTMIFHKEEDNFCTKINNIKSENQLEIINGVSCGKIVTFKDYIDIGRDINAGLGINDIGISLRHAIIKRSGKKYILSNLNPQNISFVNEKAVSKEYYLKTEDIITIGQTQIKVKLSSASHTNRKFALDSNNNFNLNFVRNRPLLFTSIAIFIFIIICNIVPNEPKKVDAYEKNELTFLISRADNLYYLNKYKEALELYENILKFDPENKIVAKQIGLCNQKIQFLLKKRQQEKQLKIVELLNKAHEYEKLRKFDEALTLLKQAQKIEPGYGEIDYSIQKIYQKLDDLKIKEEQEKQNQSQILIIKDLYQKAHDHYQNNELYSSIKLLNKIISIKIPCQETQKAIELIPKLKLTLMEKAKPYYEKGLKYYKKKKGKSLIYFYKAHEIYPEYKEVQNYINDLEKIQEPIAKKLFEDALIYEDINNIKKTKKLLSKIIKDVMPVTSNIYYKKASEKLRTMITDF